MFYIGEKFYMYFAQYLSARQTLLQKTHFPFNAVNTAFLARQKKENIFLHAFHFANFITPLDNH